MVELPSVVSEQTVRSFRNRPGMEPVVHLMEYQPEVICGFIESFDTIIDRYNAIRIETSFSPYANIRSVKRNTGNLHLPKVEDILAFCDRDTYKRFRRALHEMNQQMQKGELLEPQEPYLRYHVDTKSVSARAVGTIFHLYEEWIAQDEGFKGKFQSGEIVNSLVEALSSDQENPLYDEVANKEKLNWIDNDGGFSPLFRHSLGFN